jgi:multidrug efflux pump
MFVAGMAGFTWCRSNSFRARIARSCWWTCVCRKGRPFAATLREAQRFEKSLAKRPEIDHFIDFVGAGAPRFYLPLDQQLAAPNFAQFVVTAKSVKDRETLAPVLGEVLRKDFPMVRTRISRLENGPPIGFPVQFRVSGPEIGTVREVSDEVAKVMRANRDTTNVQFDWDEPAERSVHFEVDQVKARQLNISSQDIENYLQMSLTGFTITQFRERDKLIGVDLRAPERDRIDPSQIERLAIPSQKRHGRAVWRRSGASPTGSNTAWCGSAIGSRPSPCSPTSSTARRASTSPSACSTLSDLRAHLPVGYRIEIGGAVEENAKAQARSMSKCRCCGGRAGPLDDPIAELQPHAHGGADRAARADRRRAGALAVSQAVRLRGACSAPSRCSASSCATR